MKCSILFKWKILKQYIELIYHAKTSRIELFGSDFSSIDNLKKCKIIIGNERIDFKNQINVEKGQNIHVKILDINKVKTIYNFCYMFEGTSLFSIPNQNRWNTSEVVDMQGMFENCKFLEELPAI